MHNVRLALCPPVTRKLRLLDSVASEHRHKNEHRKTWYKITLETQIRKSGNFC